MQQFYQSRRFDVGENYINFSNVSVRDSELTIWSDELIPQMVVAVFGQRLRIH